MARRWRDNNRIDTGSRISIWRPFAFRNRK